ncbi:MAG TPA: hypothetical protein VHA15_14290 [Burkholderiales bacterium]|nr:hypothetical protein [Burkholderiales bacterium]
MPWFGRLGAPLDAGERELAQRYASGLGLEAVSVIEGWREAQALARDPGAGESWWVREDRERRRLMRETAARLGEPMLLDALTSAVEGEATATLEGALAAGGDETLARVASGAALMALNNRALALLAGCGPDHLFVQKYALFAAGRWPLGSRGTHLKIF